MLYGALLLVAGTLIETWRDPTCGDGMRDVRVWALSIVVVMGVAAPSGAAEGIFSECAGTGPGHCTFECAQLATLTVAITGTGAGEAWCGSQKVASCNGLQGCFGEGTVSVSATNATCKGIGAGVLSFACTASS